MRRVCTAPLSALTVTNDSDQDIFELVTAAGFPIELISFELYSGLSTPEVVALRLVTRSTTGSGGSAITEVNNGQGETTTIQTAASSLVTAPGTIGNVLEPYRWDQLAPFIYKPVPEERWQIPGGTRLCLNLGTAVASSRTWSGKVTWYE